MNETNSSNETLPLPSGEVEGGVDVRGGDHEGRGDLLLLWRHVYTCVTPYFSTNR